MHRNIGQFCSVAKLELRAQEGYERCDGSTSRARLWLLAKPAGDVLVQDACDKRPIRHSFFKRLYLNILEVARGKPDVDLAVLECGSACGGAQPGEFALRCDRFESAILVGIENLGFVFVKLRHLVYPLSRSRASPFDLG
jgi:hypothetical protein